MFSVTQKDDKILVFLPGEGEVSIIKETLTYYKDDEKICCNYFFINSIFLMKKDNINSGKLLLEKTICYLKDLYPPYPIRTAIKKEKNFLFDIYLSVGFKVYSLWDEYALLEYE